MITYQTIPQMFLEVGERFHKQDRSVYLTKIEGEYRGMPYQKLREMVECFALGLRDLGLEAGDRVGIISENRIEWVVSDFAVTASGAVDVPVFPTLTEKQIGYTYANCAASIVIVSNLHQLTKIRRIQDELVALEHIIVMNDDVPIDNEAQTHSSAVKVWTFSEVITKGRSSMTEEDRHHAFEKLARDVKENDLCTIIYTSGTTGNPKGVMLTHRNLCSNINAVNEIVHVDSNDVFLSYLPMCHSYERIGGFYIAFAFGATTAFAESLDTVRTNLKEIRPTIMTSVPRLFERIRNGVLANVEKQSNSKQRIFSFASSIGKKMVKEREEGSVSLATRVLYKLADTLVFSKIRELTGGRLRFFVSGGGALAHDVKEFFTMLGMVILEGYGLTESSPVLSVTVPEDDEIGTVGKAIMGVELRLADDGEILARGPNIMKGYWKDELATREAIDADGWLHTGDIGQFTKRGNLKITDRKKNIFVSSGGKNIAPQPIENEILKSKYVDQVFLIGDKREYCSALIVPDLIQIESALAGSDIQKEDLFQRYNSPAVINIILADINSYQRDLAKYERVRKITVLTEAFSVENGMMTPTLKIKRKVVEQVYAKLIDKMYS